MKSQAFIKRMSTNPFILLLRTTKLRPRETREVSVRTMIAQRRINRGKHDLLDNCYMLGIPGSPRLCR